MNTQEKLGNDLYLWRFRLWIILFLLLLLLLECKVLTLEIEIVSCIILNNFSYFLCVGKKTNKKRGYLFSVSIFKELTPIFSIWRLWSSFFIYGGHASLYF